MGSQRVRHDWETELNWTDAILLFTASDHASITSHIHSWVLFLLWLHPFILSGVIYPLISSSILGTYRPREFLFQYPIILPFHTVHGVLKARILKWFAIPFSSGPHSVRSFHHDPPVLGCPTQHGLVSLSRQGCGPSVIRLTSFCDMVSVCLPSDALLQHLPSYLGFSYLGCGISLHGCSSKVQPLLFTLDEGYLLTSALLTLNVE